MPPLPLTCAVDPSHPGAAQTQPQSAFLYLSLSHTHTASLPLVLCIPGLPIIYEMCCGWAGAQGQGTPPEKLTLYISVKRKTDMPLQRVESDALEAES